MPRFDPPLPVELQRRIAAATADLAGAEQDLRSILEALPATIRAEKRIISSVLQGALEKLAAAHQRLGEILDSSP